MNGEEGLMVLALNFAGSQLAGANCRDVAAPAIEHEAR